MWGVWGCSAVGDILEMKDLQRGRYLDYGEFRAAAESKRERKRFFWRWFLELRLLRRGVLVPRTGADWFCGWVWKKNRERLRFGGRFLDGGETFAAGPLQWYIFELVWRDPQVSLLYISYLFLLPLFLHFLLLLLEVFVRCFGVDR